MKRLSLKRSRPKEKSVQLGIPRKKVRGAQSKAEGCDVPFMDEDFFTSHHQSQLWCIQSFKVPGFLYFSDKNSDIEKVSVTVQTGACLQKKKLVSTELIRNQLNGFSKKFILKSMNLDRWEILSYPSTRSNPFHNLHSPETESERKFKPDLLLQSRKPDGNSGSIFLCEDRPLIGYCEGWKSIYKQEEMPVLNWNSVREYCEGEQQLKMLCRSKVAGPFNSGINAGAATRRLHLTRPPLIQQEVFYTT